MIDLSDVSGIPLMLDENTGSLIYDKCINCENEFDVSISEIVPVLLNKFLRYPEKVYKQYRQVFVDQDTSGSNSNVSYDVINLPYGLLGIEFVKTHIYFTDFQESKFACMIQVLLGELMVFLQKNKDDNDPFDINIKVECVEIVKLKQGDILSIPTGYFYTFVNSSTSKSIFSVICSRTQNKVDYNSLNKGKGLAYYIISKNGKVEIVANPRYKCESPPQFIEWDEAPVEIKEKYNCKDIMSEEDALYDIFKTRLSELLTVLA